MSQTERHTRDGTEQQTTEDRETTESVTTCPECSGQLEHSGAETVCSECGLVVDEDEIDRGPEWRAFDAAEKDNKSRVGAPTTNMMHDNGLSTNIGWQDKDVYGNSLSSSQRQKMQRRETASVIYRQALEQDLLPGRSIEGIATAALHAAARMEQVPRSIDEIAAVSRVKEEEFKRAYRYINRELGLEIQPADPMEYLPRFASDLDVPDETERRARELLERGKRANVHSGKSPVGLAAAAVYAAARLTNVDLTQREVSEVTDMSEVTIRNRYQELLAAEETNHPGIDSANASVEA